MSQCLWWKWFVRQRQRQEAGIMAQVITTLGTPSPPPLAILSSKAINWSNCQDRTTDGAFQAPYLTNIGIFAVIYTNDHQKNNSNEYCSFIFPTESPVATWPARCLARKEFWLFVLPINGSGHWLIETFPFTFIYQNIHKISFAWCGQKLSRYVSHSLNKIDKYE